MDIADVTCLGAKVANKFCPLRVQFNNLSHKRSALGNAKKLRDSSSWLFLLIQIFLGKKNRL